MEILRIFEDKFRSIIKDNVKSVLLDNSDTRDDEESSSKEWSPEKNNSLSCSYCRSKFETLGQQRDHYKLDWHRYNLRQSLLQKGPITEEEFDEKTTKDDISSISGSDSEKEDSLDTYATAQGKIFLQNEEGKVFSIYACLLLNKKEELPDSALNSRLHACTTNQKWAIFMLGGGHFAGAIFHKNEPILHKTFHCYTVRAGQGGTQSSRDNKSGGSHPKSAGASLRRYNEQALVQHVKGIVEAWRGELDGCGLIFYRAAGPQNRGVLFGGNTPFLDKNDGRVRSVPFSTRRATFAEVKRVYAVLTVAHVYGSLEAAVDQFSRHKMIEQTSKRLKSKATCVNRAKSREIMERPLPVKNSSDSSDENDIELSTEIQEISFESLKEFTDTLTLDERKTKKKKTRKSKTQRLKEQEEKRKNDLIESIRSGIIDQIKENLLDGLSDQSINEVLDDKGNTVLHVAAMSEQFETIDYLLRSEANPCLKNKKQQTPYTCTQSKEVRDIFKEFAKTFPEKYNYNKAQIPTNVLTPEEISEKKKAQRKLKKEKEKIKKKENEIQQKENEAQQRFLKLSDREKRALAAERRILNKDGVVISRCFLCAQDMAGKVPFEYLGNRFCSVECLKGHRMQNPVILS